MLRALAEFEIRGIPTTIPAHRLLLEHPEFKDGSYSTVTVSSGALASLQAGPETETPSPADGDGLPEAVLMVEGGPVSLWHPAVAGSISAATRTGGGDGQNRILSPMHGTILEILVTEGGEIERGQPVAILEAMKMETYIVATNSGTVQEIGAGPGDVVAAGQVVAVIVPR